ncbi:helix-turn-helix domain-containing protein [Christensenellaceae bacterium OttesenSCG-928-M15]|nr:helix-turn-helix domain-containing protein [Christensenellaceae bacterium OttesenSCG-928-M15]
MPFVEMNVQEEIEKRLATDPEFREAWESSREEYRILGEVIQLRKEQGMSQTDLANATGTKQQMISRLEKHENSPTLRTLCNVLEVLGYTIKLEPKR